MELHLTYDEEAGGEIGPGCLIERNQKPDIASAPDSPTPSSTPTMAACTGGRGPGRSAHAAKPLTGVDALEAANHMLRRSMRGASRWRQRTSAVPGIGSPQMTVGLIEGGINTNVVPDRITFRLDRRMVPEENPAQVEAELMGSSKARRSLPRSKVAIRRILLAEPLTPLPGAERLAGLLCEHATRIMGEPVTTSGVPLYTDARHYRRTACRSCSTARAPARSRKPTPTGPTSGSSCRTFTRPRKWWR